MPAAGSSCIRLLRLLFAIVEEMSKYDSSKGYEKAEEHESSIGFCSVTSAFKIGEVVEAAPVQVELRGKIAATADQLVVPRLLKLAMIAGGMTKNVSVRLLYHISPIYRAKQSRQCLTIPPASKKIVLRMSMRTIRRPVSGSIHTAARPRSAPKELNPPTKQAYFVADGTLWKCCHLAARMDSVRTQAANMSCEKRTTNPSNLPIVK